MQSLRHRPASSSLLVLAAAAAAACSAAPPGDRQISASEPVTSSRLANLDTPLSNATLRTYTDNPLQSMSPQSIASLPFVTSYGTNGRACVHCHVPSDGWGTSAAAVQYRFTHPMDTTQSSCVIDPFSCAQEPNAANYGLDPIFRPVDGANSPLADVSTAAARQSAYSMLLTKGLIRVGIGIPANAEFTLAAVDDPYGYASAAQLSLFRRPLPSTNLRLSPPPNSTTATPVLTSVMWDGRETQPGDDIVADLLNQANGATLGHAQATAGLSSSDLQAIVNFETGLHTAVESTSPTGDLSIAGGNGGPQWLAANQTFYPGINDALTGDSQTGAPFNPNVFTIFSAWANAASAGQAQLARGEAIFNTRQFSITGVGGLNDALGKSSIVGTCTTCHDSPNYGHHSVAMALNVGVSDGARRTPDMPLYTLRNVATGATVQTTDPGRALITGKWADIGKFKGPILRGLAARAPYFHNGSAATLADAVQFYNTRFNIGLSDSEKADLAAFLQAL